MVSQSTVTNLIGLRHIIDDNCSHRFFNHPLVLHQMTITKAQALSQFKYNWKVETLRTKWNKDLVAKRESWNNFTDALCKEGYITESQCDRWSNPF